jgi:hypothetical protein
LGLNDQQIIVEEDPEDHGETSDKELGQRIGSTNVQSWFGKDFINQETKAASPKHLLVIATAAHIKKHLIKKSITLRDKQKKPVSKLPFKKSNSMKRCKKFISTGVQKGNKNVKHGIDLDDFEDNDPELSSKMKDSIHRGFREFSEMLKVTGCAMKSPLDIGGNVELPKKNSSGKPTLGDESSGRRPKSKHSEIENPLNQDFGVSGSGNLDSNVHYVQAPCDGSFSNSSGNRDSGVKDQFLQKNKPDDDSKRDLPLLGDKRSPVIRRSADSKKVYRQTKTIGTEHANKYRAKVPMGYGKIPPIVILAPS